MNYYSKEGIGTNPNSIKEMLYLYKTKKLKAHLVLKGSRRFYNGFILEITENLFIINDNKLGEVPVQIQDVFLIENFHEPPNGGEK